MAEPEEHTLKEHATPSREEPHVVIAYPTCWNKGCFAKSPLKF